MASAFSSIVPYRFISVLETVWSTMSYYQAFTLRLERAVCRSMRRGGASLPSGATALTRIPRSPFSNARQAVKALTPPLAAP